MVKYLLGFGSAALCAGVVIFGFFCCRNGKKPQAVPTTPVSSVHVNDDTIIEMSAAPASAAPARRLGPHFV